MLSCKCKHQPDSYILLGYFGKLFFCRKFLYWGNTTYCESILISLKLSHEGTFVPKTEFTIFICLCSSLWAGKRLSSSLDSDAEQGCKSLVHFLGVRRSNRYWLLWFWLQWSGKNGRMLPHCPQKQDTCLLFPTEEDYVINFNPDLGSYRGVV